MSRIRGPYVRFCERDEAVTPHPTQLFQEFHCATIRYLKIAFLYPQNAMP